MTFKDIKLEKGLYSGEGLTANLEKADPSENYRGTALEKTDAFQRQLRRFGIRTSGRDSDRVEKFFSTSDSSVLFPEYVARSVERGIRDGEALDSILAATVNVDSPVYRSFSRAETDDAMELKDVAEGAFIPETTVTLSDKVIDLRKRGRMLTASYEALRYQRIDEFTLALRRIGAYIARSQFADAVEALIGEPGDEPENVTASGSTLAYEDLLKLWNSFDGFNMDRLIVPPDMMAQLLALPEFRTSNGGVSFRDKGVMITPFGATVIRSSAAVSGTIIGLDSTAALEKICSGGVVTDYDRLIDRQIERAAITCTAGFSRVYKDAMKTLTVA